MQAREPHDHTVHTTLDTFFPTCVFQSKSISAKSSDSKKLSVENVTFSPRMSKSRLQKRKQKQNKKTHSQYTFPREIEHIFFYQSRQSPTRKYDRGWMRSASFSWIETRSSLMQPEPAYASPGPGFRCVR